MKRAISSIFRVFLIILIVIDTLFCIIKLFSNSTTLYIDKSKLEIRSDYNESNNIPIYNSNLLLLEGPLKTPQLSFNLSGTYHKETYSYELSQAIAILDDKSISYVWVPTNESVGFWLCFTNNKESLLVYESENIFYILDFRYITNRLTITGDFEQKDTYTSKFSYGELSSNKSIDFYKLWILIISFFNYFFIQWFWEIATSLLGAIILYFIVFKRTSRLIKNVYTFNLRDNLFPKEHSWFGNNSPNEIYVSVRVFLKTISKEHNLLEYVDEAFTKTPTAYAIIGNAGEGKSFSLSRIALGLLDGYFSSVQKRRQCGKKIPLILNFADILYAKSDDELIEHIYNKICSVSGIKRRKFLLAIQNKMLKTVIHYINMGYFVIMIDGYDEISDGEVRRQCSKTIISFMKEYNKCIYIITSRTTIYEKEQFSNITNKHTLYLSPLSKEQIHIFLNKWLFPKGKSSMELYNRIINTIQIESVISNPLLLTMLTHVYSASNFEFSKSRVQLYADCSSCLLKKWDDEKTKRKRIVRFDMVDANTKIILLSLFANYMHINNLNSLNKSELSQLFTSHPLEASCFHGRASEVVDEILNQSGLLERTDSEQIRFRHRSFFEYFVALHWSKNDSIDWSHLDNIGNEQNIMFFYFSMVKSEYIVINFINQNLEKLNLIIDILIERKISYYDSIGIVALKLINNINYEDIIKMQTLGYLAQQYPNIADTIRQALVKRLLMSDNATIKGNIIIGLMCFCDAETMEIIFQEQLKNIDIKSLVKYSGEALDNFSVLIIKLIQTDVEKIKFVELLASTYRFGAIYNIYTLGSIQESKIATLGLLYMTREFELFRWLENREFRDSVDNQILQDARVLLKEYDWAGNELSDQEKLNLFVLIRLSKNIISEYNKVNNQMIHNRIAFLLSYIISKEKNKVYTNLINIDGITIKSVSEFAYHWRKRVHARTKKQTKLIGISIRSMNYVILYIMLSVFFGQMTIWVYTYAKIMELFFQGYQIDDSVTNNFGSIPIGPEFNIYLYTLLGFSLIYYITNKLIKNMDYNRISRLVTLFCCSLIINIYISYIYNFTFRVMFIFAALMVAIIEMIKHRNNYPSFKEPQYSRIVEYLKQ